MPRQAWILPMPYDHSYHCRILCDTTTQIWCCWIQMRFGSFSVEDLAKVRNTFKFSGAASWSAAKISGLAWPRAPNSVGSAVAKSSAEGVVGGDKVDDEGRGDVLGPLVAVVDSGISSVLVVGGLCFGLSTMTSWTMIFSDFGSFTGLKESSEDFAEEEGLKVSAWRCLLTFLLEVGTKSRGFRFPPLSFFWADSVSMTFSPWPSRARRSSIGRRSSFSFV